MGILNKPKTLEMAIVLVDLESPTIPTTGVPLQLAAWSNITSLPLANEKAARKATPSETQLSWSLYPSVTFGRRLSLRLISSIANSMVWEYLNP